MNGDKISLDNFFKQCKFCFGFLVTDYNFSDPKILNEKPYYLVVFNGDYLSIECSYDIRDDMVSVYVSKLNHGRNQDCFRVNENNEVVRENLYTLLRGRFTEMNHLVKESTSDKSILLRRDLCLSADLLKNYGQDILENSTKIFDKLMPEDGDMF